MLAARSSKTVVKVLAVMMMVLSVLFSGCANKEDEWKKACQEFNRQFGEINMIASDYSNELSRYLREYGTGEVSVPRAKYFYRLKEVMPEAEVLLQKVEKIAKENDNPQWKGTAQAWRAEINHIKTQALKNVQPKPGFITHVPEEDRNWDKKVIHNDIKDKLLKGEIKSESGKSNYNRDFTAPADENAPWKETSKKNDSKSQKAETAETVKGDKTGVITGTEVRMRDAGNLNSSVLGYFDKSEKVAILESKNGWYKVRRANGKEGWVSADFCKAQ